MSPIIVIAADALVAVLLVATIATSVGLSRRITRLKADESAMRGTIAELVTATENAERAIAGLRTTLGDCDRTLADRLRTAERYAADLAEQVEAGEGVMARIIQMVETSRRLAASPPMVTVPAGARAAAPVASVSAAAPGSAPVAPASEAPASRAAAPAAAAPVALRAPEPASRSLQEPQRAGPDPAHDAISAAAQALAERAARRLAAQAA